MDRTVATTTGDWMKKGAIAGLIGGLVFAVFEMFVSAFGDAGPWAPFRMIAGIVLGSDALSPTTSLATAIITGSVIHFSLSALFGAIYGWFAYRTPALQSRRPMIVGGTIYGLILWLVNFQIIARMAGWTWFPEEASQFWQGFVAHSFFYGTVLGRSLNRQTRSGEVRSELRKAA